MYHVSVCVVFMEIILTIVVYIHIVGTDADCIQSICNFIWLFHVGPNFCGIKFFMTEKMFDHGKN